MNSVSLEDWNYYYNYTDVAEFLDVVSFLFGNNSNFTSASIDHQANTSNNNNHNNNNNNITNSSSNNNNNNSNHINGTTISSSINNNNNNNSFHHHHHHHHHQNNNIIVNNGDNNVSYELTWNKLINLPDDRILLATLLSLFSLITVLGNLLVIVAVFRERYLHTSTNYFVTSLAFADCLVGLVVMPFSTLYEVLQRHWIFGIMWCDVWRSLDVLFSTASILNLCVISLDRYWAITDPFTYPTKMSRKRAYCLITIVWICSSLISFPAILWWRAVRIEEELPPLKCPFTDNLGYLIFSSTISFYLPLLVMVFTYYKIYRAAVHQTRSLKSGIKQVPLSSGDTGLTLRMHRGGTEKYHHHHHHHSVVVGGGGSTSCSSNLQQQQSSSECGAGQSSLNSSSLSAAATSCNGGLQQLSRQRSANFSARSTHTKTLHKNFSLSRKLSKFAKEKKAAKTLGIVMGVFIVCWLPFFILNLLSGFCVYCIPYEDLISPIVAWLGWLNSGMNPFIYACWSKDFRRTQSKGEFNNNIIKTPGTRLTDYS